MNNLGQPLKSNLLLDNVPSHTTQTNLKVNDEMSFTKFLPPNVTDLIQPMDQGVILMFEKTVPSTYFTKICQRRDKYKKLFTKNIIFWKQF